VCHAVEAQARARARARVSERQCLRFESLIQRDNSRWRPCCLHTCLSLAKVFPVFAAMRWTKLNIFSPYFFLVLFLFSSSHRVQVCSASETINKRPSDYWLLVMDIARRFDLKRVLGCGSALGVRRAAGDRRGRRRTDPNHCESGCSCSS
jgi:hypothetical protein